MASTSEVTRAEPPAATKGTSGPAWAGIAFGPLFVVGFIMAVNTPSNDASDATWISFYSQKSNQVQTIIGAYLLIVSALLFLVFALGMQQRVKAGRGGAPVLYQLLAGTAVLVSGLIMVSAVQLAGIMGNILFGSQPFPQNADVLRANTGIAGIALAATLTAAVFIACGAFLARRVGLFGTGMFAFSIVAAVLLFFAVAFFPMVALPIWVLVAGIALLRSSTASSN